MNQTLRIALAQINTTVGDIPGNADRVRRTLDDARRQEVDVVVFPELTLTGYPAEDLWLRPSFQRASREALEALVPATHDLAAVIGFADSPERGLVHNAVALVHDCELVTVYHKQRLPNYGVFDEARYFRPGLIPRLVSFGGVGLGLTICEDIWVPSGPGEAECRLGGATILLNPSASPFHLGKPAYREKIFGDLARGLGCHLLVCNLVGGQDELVFDGNSLYIGPDGRVRLRGRAFAEDLLVIDVVAESRSAPAPEEVGIAVERFERPPFRDRPRPPVPPRSPDTSAGEAPGEVQLHEMYAALCLGTRDYVGKNGFSKVLIGLSGGIDSALTAVVAADALGPEAVIGVGMPSRYSSPESVEDARDLANRLGIVYREIPIDDVYDRLLSALTPSFQGLPFDVTEENLQARVRGNILMALSNKFAWLVLTTGNKSEVAVGYTTLYGDTAGGFAVLKDLYKTSVYALARLRNRQAEVIPERTLTKPPSAELRPDQKDTDSLPPYAVLDPILEAYIERDLSVDEIVQLGHSREVVRDVIRLVDRTEYKRRQSPPGIKITARAFGKDRRWPITSAWVVGSPARSPSK